eukprot:TRINITY_DN2340_c0_g1_i1.p2 TRINITY_DN2340_c0_g1~~TRINITY_DN2340_c0_g1_i1.p2  ORF type:complete len:156 (+),score=27.45 TRINITY_DN2340_c0_g1_i1:28-468(+)
MVVRRVRKECSNFNWLPVRHRFLATQLIKNDRIVTTLGRAQKLKPLVEWAIATAQLNSPEAYHSLAAFLKEPQLARSAMDDFRFRFMGYDGPLVVIKPLQDLRQGDRAEMALVEIANREQSFSYLYPPSMRYKTTRSLIKNTVLDT